MLNRLRELRGLALAAASYKTESLPVENVQTIRSGIRTLHWVQLGFDESCPAYGVVAVDDNGVHLWCSERWSKRASHLVARAVDPNVSLEDWNADLQAFIAGNRFSVADVFGDDDASPAEPIELTDHTTCGLPLSCILDPRRRYFWTVAMPDRQMTEKKQPARRRVRFWGQFEYREKVRMTASEDRREVLYESRPCFTYPDREVPGIAFKGLPRPLPYAYFERWFLEDLAKLCDVDVGCRYGTHPTRSAFLREAEVGDGILHITTHGHADLDRIECSHLLFARDGDSPTIVHSLDILARDWSSYDVVILNACLTSAGRKIVGEEFLSFAWAFLAGGAKAVIGCRWPVADKVAWQFCRAFYTYYFGSEWQNDESLRQAFAGALNTLDVDRPGDWGSFVLLN